MEGICTLFELCNPQMLSDYTLARITAQYKKQNLSTHEEYIQFVVTNVSPKPQRNYRDTRIGKRLKEKQMKRKLNLKRIHEKTTSTSADHTSKSKYSKQEHSSHNNSSPHQSSSTTSTAPRYSTFSSSTASTKSTSSANGSNGVSASEDGGETPTKRKKIGWP